MAFYRAKRDAVPLWIGLTSKSGGGKTYSALRIARGIAGDRPFAAVDTETRRMSHYADEFTFDVENMEPPFRPDRFLQFAKDAQKAGYPALVIDSFSHEWMGIGGVIDWHEEEMDRMAGKNASWDKREAMNFPAWRKPKTEHRDMVDGLLQIRMPLIFCLRGKAPVKMEKDPQTGKRIVVEGDFTAITGDDLPYEMTALLVLSSKAPGSVDLSQPNKISKPVRHLVRDGVVLDERFGSEMAAWARGGANDPAAGEAKGASAARKDERRADPAPEDKAQPASEPTQTQAHDHSPDAGKMIQDGASDGQPAPEDDDRPFIVDEKGRQRRAATIEVWTEGWEGAMRAAQQKKNGKALRGLRERNADAFEHLAKRWPGEVADIRRLLDLAISSLEAPPQAA